MTAGRARSSVLAVSVLAVAVTVLVSIAPSSAATSAEQGPTGVDSLSAVRSGGTVQVQGTATFVDVPAVVGTDPEGDARIPGIGADFTAATIGRPDPFGDYLRFTLSIADQPDDLYGVPEAVCYQWQMSVGGTVARVKGYRTQQSWDPGSLEASFRLNPGSLPTQGLPLSGRIEDGVVQFSLPMSAVGAQAGATITPPPLPGQIDAQLLYGAAAQCPSGPATALDDMTFGSYVIPQATVGLGLAPSGTQPDAIAITSEATVQPDGSFAGSISTVGRPPGTYVVLARACYGESNCGDATATITL